MSSDVHGESSVPFSYSPSAHVWSKGEYETLMRVALTRLKHHQNSSVTTQSHFDQYLNLFVLQISLISNSRRSRQGAVPVIDGNTRLPAELYYYHLRRR